MNFVAQGKHIVIIGLGNPGEKFEGTYHNTGFSAVDFFAEKNGFPVFALSKKFLSLVAKKEDIMLAKPQTFMNESGKAARKLKGENTPIVVIHDDIDLPSGKIKIVKERGSAGHKGVESIIKSIGNKRLVRIRIGIHPANGKPTHVEKLVLKKLSAQEQLAMEAVLAKTAEAIASLIAHGLEKTMNEFNR